MKKKKKFTYTVLGFPVVLIDFPFKEVRGVEVPVIKLNQFQNSVFRLLILKPVNFTGAEVRFIRSYMRLTQTEFAKILNQANHSSVSQWEKSDLKRAGMDHNTELLLRFHMASSVSEDTLEEILGELLKFKVQKKTKPEPLKIDRIAA